MRKPPPASRWSSTPDQRVGGFWIPDRSSFHKNLEKRLSGPSVEQFFLFCGSPFGALLLPLAPFWFHLERFWLNFGRFGFPFGVLWVPCWSIWLYFDVLKPTLRPTTPKNNYYSVPGVLAFLGSLVSQIYGVPVSIILDVALFLN